MLPYPSLHIGWAWALPYDDGPPESEGKYTLQPFNVFQISDDVWSPIIDTREKPLQAYGYLLAEVRLAILPLGLRRSPEPVFMTKLWTELWIGHELKSWVDQQQGAECLPGYLRWPWTYKTCPDTGFTSDEGRLRFEPAPDADWQDDTWKGLVGREPPLVMDSSRRQEGYGRSDHEGGVRPDIVSPASCRAILKLHLLGSHPWEPFKAPIPKIVCGHWSPHETGRCRTPGHMLARHLEEAFFMAAPEHRFNTLLEQACTDAFARVSEYLEPIKADRRRIKEEVISSLKNNIHENS